MPPQPLPSKYVILGKIGAPYGVQGYNHIQSYTEPPEQILGYANWMIRNHKDSQFKDCAVKKGRVHAQGVVAQLEGIADRDAAQLMTGSEIAISRDSLPALPAGEYYWTDLEGLSVETVSGMVLGTVAYLYPNAGHTNMVVKDEQRERHIPFIEPDFVTQVSLEQKKIIVDWDPEL